MKLLRLLLIFCTVVLLSAAAKAQPTFLVMSSKGKVEADMNGKWKAVKVGMELPASATVKTSYSSYVKLMMGKGRLVGIDENTTKKLSDFAGKRDRDTDSKTNTILAYAARQMKKGREQTRGTEFGAVRGEMEVFNATFPKYAIMTVQPEFRIVDETDSRKYTVEIYDYEMNKVASRTVKDDRFTYFSEDPTLEPGDTYYWKVTRMEDGLASDVQRFTVLDPDTIAAIRQELVNLDTELTRMGADTVMHHLIRGVYFEQKQLYYDAFREYKMTVQLAPEVQEYKDMLEELLLSLALYNEKKYLLDE